MIRSQLDFDNAITGKFLDIRITPSKPGPKKAEYSGHVLFWENRGYHIH
jgi:hypothetical protein